MHRRAVEPAAGALILEEPPAEGPRGAEQDLDEVEGAAELERGEQPRRPGDRWEPGQHRRAQRLVVLHVRCGELTPRGPVARVDGVEGRRGRVDVAHERDRAPVVQGMRHRDLGLHPAQPVAFERQLREHRRRRTGGVDGREDVVVEAGERELRGRDRAAEVVLGLEHEHRPAALGERDGGAQPVGAAADDDRVDLRARHAVSPDCVAIWCSIDVAASPSPQKRDCMSRPTRR